VGAGLWLSPRQQSVIIGVCAYHSSKGRVRQWIFDDRRDDQSMSRQGRHGYASFPLVVACHSGNSSVKFRILR